MQADLKTFSSLGVHGLTAVSCIVAETPAVVSQVHPVPVNLLQSQIELLLKSYPVGAIKTGMLYSKSHIVAVCELVADINIPLVVDPVMVASTGDPLLVEDALLAISDRLLPLATVITPNLPEAGILLGRPVLIAEEQEKAAYELAEKYNCACYLKGGHLPEGPDHQDLLVIDGEMTRFTAPHIEIDQTHGTGCTLAAALTAGLSKGLSIPDAAKLAHDFAHEAIKSSLSWVMPGTEKKISHLNQVLNWAQVGS